MTEKEEFSALVAPLDSLPIAVVWLRVVNDTAGKPTDFIPVYLNRAARQLIGVAMDVSLNAPVLETCPNLSPLLLSRIARAAGGEKQSRVRSWVPELERFLIAQTYQPMEGIAGVVLQDNTPYYLLRMRAAAGPGQERPAMHDPLTRLLTEAAGRKMAEAALKEAAEGRDNTFFRFHIDHLQSINDIYGEFSCNLVLQKFARMLLSVFRQTDVVFRLEKGDFAAFTPNAGTDYFLKRVSGEIFDLTSHLPGLEFPVSVSISAAIGPASATYDAFFRVSEEALTEVRQKSTGSFIRKYL